MSAMSTVCDLRGSYLIGLIFGRVRLGSFRNKNNWNNASKRLFGSYSHSGIPGFHSGYSSRIAGIYSGIHSYSGIFPNERALCFVLRLGPAMASTYGLRSHLSFFYHSKRKFTMVNRSFNLVEVTLSSLLR